MQALRIRQLSCEPTDICVVVESLVLEQRKFSSGCVTNGKLEPVAVVIGRHDDVHAFDMRAKSIDLEQLKTQLPELNATIASFLSQSGVRSE